MIIIGVVSHKPSLELGIPVLCLRSNVIHIRIKRKQTANYITVPKIRVILDYFNDCKKKLRTLKYPILLLFVMFQVLLLFETK